MAKIWVNLRHDWRMYWLSFGVQMRAAAMLRGAFITQILGMIFNNICLMGAWLFFFHYFGSVNGWSGTDFIGMMGVNSLVFGLTSCVSIGLMDLPRHVDSGSFDSFLTKPSSILGTVASSNSDVTTIGDMLFGVALIIWYAWYAHAGPLDVLLFAVALCSACIIFFCFAILLPNILAFYVFDSERLGRYFGTLFLDAGLYPAGVLTGVLRTIFLVAIPALLFAAVPLDILRGLNWHWVGLGAVVAGGWLAVCLWLFRRALRRYESANLIGAR